MRKLLLLIVALLVASTACGRGLDESLTGVTTSTAPPATTTTTEAISLVTTTTGPPTPLVVWVQAVHIDAVEAAAASFTAAVGVPVEVVAMTLPDIRAAMVSNTTGVSTPDVFYGSHTWLADLIAVGRIAPTGLGIRVDEFYEVASRAFTFAGNDYGVPVAMHPTVFVYNRILVSSELSGFSQVKAACEDLAGQIERCVEVPSDDPFGNFPFLSAPGGYLLGYQDGVPNPGDIGIAGASATEGAEFLADLAADGVLASAADLPSALTRFYDGTSPFMIVGTEGIAILSGDAPAPPNLVGRFAPFAVSPLPIMGGNIPRSLVEVEGFYLNRESLQPGAAATFVRDYIAADTAMTALFEASPMPPAFGVTADAAARGTVMAAMLEAAAGGTPIPPISNIDDVLEELAASLARLYVADVSAQDVLDAAAGAIASILGS